MQKKLAVTQAEAPNVPQSSASLFCGPALPMCRCSTISLCQKNLARLFHRASCRWTPRDSLTSPPGSGNGNEKETFGFDSSSWLKDTLLTGICACWENRLHGEKIKMSSSRNIDDVFLLWVVFKGLWIYGRDKCIPGFVRFIRFVENMDLCRHTLRSSYSNGYFQLFMFSVLAGPSGTWRCTDLRQAMAKAWVRHSKLVFLHISEKCVFFFWGIAW